MQTLYLMRHGQTVYNTQSILQGRCDSPLTETGVVQAKRTATWLREQDVSPTLLAVSPLGRAQQTLDIVCETVPAYARLPRLAVPGLAERDYGSFEGKPVELLPASPWNPGDVAVTHGGESSACARFRIVSTLRSLMDGCDGDVLAISHGSISLTFKTAWHAFAQCEQNVQLGNCCVLVFDYDRAARTFSNTAIVNAV